MNDFERLAEKEKEYVLQTYTRYPLALKRGKGAFVWDLDNKKYLDFLAGIAVNALGYGHPAVTKEIQKALKHLVHTSNYFYTRPQADYAEKLSNLTNKGKVFFSNSGAEANECALKLARAYGSRPGVMRTKIVTLENSFHGRTLATVFATGQTKYQEGFGPPAGDYAYLEINHISQIPRLVKEDVAAVIVELVQGEGGVNVLKQDFVKALWDVCKKKDILFMADEIQTGFGRTGKLFAFEHYALLPDVITLAKPAAGGLPMGLTVIKKDYAGLLKPGMHASTFGGGYLVCSAALKVLEIISDEKFLARVRSTGDYFLARLNALKEKYDFIAEVRGMGLMLGLELKFSAREFVNKALQEGLIINCVQENVLRFVPPLIITEKEAEKAAGILDLLFSRKKAGR